jgi:hypothetical protein
MNRVAAALPICLLPQSEAQADEPGTRSFGSGAAHDPSEPGPAKAGHYVRHAS